MTTITTLGVDLLTRFCTPTQRETAGKSVESLAMARRIDVLHTTVTSYPHSPSTEQINLACYEWGTGDKIVILTHGWEWQAGRMSAFVPDLIDAGWHVIAFDAPAHGQSGGTELNLVDYGRSIRSVAQHFGEPRAVIGHSFGGTAAAWYVAHEPHRLDAFVSIAAGSGGEFLMRNFVQRAKIGLEAEGAVRDAFCERFGGSPSTFSVEHFGRQICARTLIAHDRRDTIVGFDQGEQFAKSITGAQIHITTGLGHRGILRDADVIDTVVRFIAERS